jgi:phosphatidate cytidylyltransferase
MSTLLIRSITGAFFGIVVIASILLGTHYLAILFGIFLSLGLWEYSLLFKQKSNSISPIQTTIIGVAIYFLLVYHECLKINQKLVTPLITSILFVQFVKELWLKKENPIIASSLTTFSIFYLVLPFYIVNLFENTQFQNFPVLLGLIILIWTNDTFAYLVGSKIGKTPLFERISPKKTIEGTIGGIFFTFIAAVIIGYFSKTEDLFFWIISAVICSIFAVLGDLLESLFKRSIDIKDTGNILPGHGGILDRFDALIFTIPFFYIWFEIYKSL